MDTSFDVQPAAVFLVHRVYKQVAFRVGIFEGRLKLEAQMLVESTGLLVGRGHYPRDPFAAKLNKWVVKTKPQVLSAKPLTTRYCRNMHQQIRAVEVFIENTRDEALFQVEQPDRRTTAGRPSTTSPGTNPRADDVVLSDQNLFHSTPPTS